MNIQVVFPVLISFAISVILGPIVIPFLRRLKMGQTERVEGVQSHLKKAGTPTMGGVIFLIAAVVTTLFYAKDYPNVIPVLFLTLGFGIIGFLDDYLKVVLRRSDGLLAWQKFGLQVVVTGIFVYYILNYTNVDLAMRIPFWPNHYLNLGWLAIPVLFFAVIGTVNGVNFTDGLDGLASSVTLIVAVFFTVVSIGTRKWYRAGDRSGSRRTDGIPSVQCISGKSFYGGYRISGFGRICCGGCLHDADAAVYSADRTDLSGRSAVCYDSGYVF